MKKLFCILLMMVVMAYTPVVMAGTALSKEAHVSVNNIKGEKEALIKRVYEIQKMDFSKLNATEKNELKNELLGINKRLNDPDFTGLYLSSGVIIIILIVLLVLALGRH